MDSLHLEYYEKAKQEMWKNNPKDYNFYLGFSLGAQAAMFILMEFSVCKQCNTANPNNEVEKSKDGSILCIRCKMA